MAWLGIYQNAEVNIFFLTIHVLSFKVFGIFVFVSLEITQQRKAWERYSQCLNHLYGKMEI